MEQKTRVNLSPLDSPTLERRIKFDHKGTFSTAGSNNQSEPVRQSDKLLRTKYHNITENHYAFDIMAMVTSRPMTKALTAWQEIQYSNPGEYDYFNGYCKADRFNFHMSIALKYHQFNMDRPVFYRLNQVADIHELNLVRQKMVQKRAIEQALKCITQDQVEACFVDLKKYANVEVLMIEDHLKPVDDEVLDLSRSYVIYKAVSLPPPPIVVIDVIPTESTVVWSSLESYYYVLVDKLFAGWDGSNLLNVSQSSFECPSYFTDQRSTPPETYAEQSKSRPDSVVSSKGVSQIQDQINSLGNLQVQTKKTESHGFVLSRIASPAINSKYLQKYRVVAGDQRLHKRENTVTNFEPLRKINSNSKIQLKKKTTWESPLNIKPEESIVMNEMRGSHSKKQCFSITELIKSKQQNKNTPINTPHISPDRSKKAKLTNTSKVFDSPNSRSRLAGTSFIIKRGQRRTSGGRQQTQPAEDSISLLQCQTSLRCKADRRQQGISRQQTTFDWERSSDVKSPLKVNLKQSIVSKLLTKGSDCFAMYRQPQKPGDKTVHSPLYASVIKRRLNRPDQGGSIHN